MTEPGEGPIVSEEAEATDDTDATGSTDPGADDAGTSGPGRKDSPVGGD